MILAEQKNKTAAKMKKSKYLRSPRGVFPFLVSVLILLLLGFAIYIPYTWRGKMALDSMYRIRMIKQQESALHYRNEYLGIELSRAVIDSIIEDNKVGNVMKSFSVFNQQRKQVLFCSNDKLGMSEEKFLDFRARSAICKDDFANANHVLGYLSRGIREGVGLGFDFHNPYQSFSELPPCGENVLSPEEEGLYDTYFLLFHNLRDDLIWCAFDKTDKADIEKILATLKLFEGNASDWQSYRNEEFGFEVKYPQGWHIYSSTVPSIKILSFQNLSNEVAIDVNESSFFRFDLRIIDEPVESWLARQSSLCESLGTECYSERTKIGENEAYFIKGGQKKEDGVEGFSRVLFHGDKTYLAETLWPEECSFWNQPQKCEVFDQMLSTFRFIQPEKPAEKIVCPSVNVAWIDGWKTYQNEMFAFQFQYPDDWAAIESKDPGKPYLVFVEFGPEASIQEGGSSAVAIRNQTEEAFVLDLQREFVIGGSAPICLGNKAATEYDFYRSGDADIVWKTVVVPQGEYLIEFSMGTNRGGNIILEQILSTFRFF